jgi:hypothetical protein
MSQRDLAAELRAARVEAPPEVRERVRLIAAAAPAPPRRITWRRAAVVLVPAAAAIAAAVLVTRPSHHPSSALDALRTQTAGPLHAELAAPTHASAGAVRKAFTVPSSQGRAQQYDASLSLRFDTAEQVSDAVKRALRITTSVGGYSVSVHASTHGKQAIADLRLKVPRSHVQGAMASLLQLGTLTGEDVSTVDRQALLNATDRQIARLQTQLTALRAQTPTPQLERRIAALVARVERLQRGEAATRRATHYATIALHLATALVVIEPKHGHGPLHGVVVALKWLGIGAVYALAIGLPVALVLGILWLAMRGLRRRRVDALLNRS